MNGFRTPDKLYFIVDFLNGGTPSSHARVLICSPLCRRALLPPPQGAALHRGPHTLLRRGAHLRARVPAQEPDHLPVGAACVPTPTLAAGTSSLRTSSWTATDTSKSPTSDCQSKAFPGERTKHIRSAARPSTLLLRSSKVNVRCVAVPNSSAAAQGLVMTRALTGGAW